MANTQLQKTPTNTNSRQEFTFSFWLKRSQLSSEQCVWTTRLNSSNNTLFKFNANDTFTFKCNKSNADALVLTSNALFRDTSAWYNFVIAVDTTQSTDTNRVKIYINGVQETSFGTASYPSQNLSLEINESGNQECLIGSENNQNYFDGSMSYFAFVSETQELPTIFGETDSTTGEWKIKTTITPSVAWGTNGFLILVNGNSLTDQSTNSNNFALGGGTLTKTEDSPSNVFNVWNRNFLTRHHNESTSIPGMLQNGNATFNSTANAFIGYKAGTLGATSGKWYWEGKIIDNGRMYIGICYPNVVQGINEPHYDNQTYSAVTINNAGEVYGRYTGSAIDEYASSVSFANNDIIGFALDMDNKALYIHKNGTYINSGNPASGASRTGSVIEQLTGTRDSYLGSGNFVSPFVGDPSNSGTFHCENNFGNGFFGTTGITTNSGNGYAGAEGSSIFNYQPPTGYSALSTKGLNQ